MRHLNPACLIVGLLLAFVFAGLAMTGCGRDGVSEPTPIEEPPTPPDDSGSKALDGGQMGGDVHVS